MTKYWLMEVKALADNTRWSNAPPVTVMSIAP